MGRFFNREAGMVALALLLTGLGISLLAGLEPWLVGAVTAGIVALFHWPVTLWFQNWILGFYTEHDRTDRALELAIQIRDSSVLRRDRENALLQVAFIHCARGTYPHALENLNRIVTSSLKPMTKTVVEATTAYTLAWLERDLPRAEALIQSSIKAFPQEPLFGFFLGLVRFKQNRHAEAKELILKSLQEDPSPKDPHPGERPYVLAQVLKALGDTAGAKAELEKAKAIKGRFGELAAKELAG